MKAAKTPQDLIALAKDEGITLDLADVQKALKDGHVDLHMIAHLNEMNK